MSETLTQTLDCLDDRLESMTGSQILERVLFQLASRSRNCAKKVSIREAAARKTPQLPIKTMLLNQATNLRARRADLLCAIAFVQHRYMQAVDDAATEYFVPFHPKQYPFIP